MPTARDEISIEGERSVTSKGERFLLSTDGEYRRSKSFLDLVLSRFCMFYAYTRPRYQVSIYRTIGPLVYH